MILTVILLCLMEISLSFDNAVLNATLLKKMSAIWQRRFIIWGMPVAVFGMRLLFPIVVVAVSSHTLPLNALRLAYTSPDEYIGALKSAQPIIDTFGGIFLLMVFLKFVCDREKSLHWFPWLEKKLAFVGRFEYAEIIIASSALVIAQSFMIESTAHACLLAGMASILLHALISAFAEVFEGLEITDIRNGLFQFIYLEIIDASCSFDGVFAAFVFTNNILFMMLGLGIGALAIRSLTLSLVHGGTLGKFIYLEHGAHYGIGALGIIMLTDIFYPVPEPITGMVGLGFIGLSLISSLRAR